jgi:hypothetical protein
MFTDSGEVRSYAESDLTTNDPVTGGTRGHLSLSPQKVVRRVRHLLHLEQTWEAMQYILTAAGQKQ